MKKYGIPFGSGKTSGKGAAKATDAPGPDEAVVPPTPSDHKVVKAKNPTTPRKKAALKGKKAKTESDDEDVPIAEVNKAKGSCM